MPTAAAGPEGRRRPRGKETPQRKPQRKTRKSDAKTKAKNASGKLSKAAAAQAAAAAAAAAALPPRPSHCAPARFDQLVADSAGRRQGSCLADAELAELARALGAPAGALSSATPELLRWLHARLGTRPGEGLEAAWPDLPDVASAAQGSPALASALQRAFRPKHPEAWLRNPRAWLSNFDIAAVMRQYEEAVPGFRFPGVFPSDFSAPDPAAPSSQPRCVSASMCALSVAGLLRQGVRHVGIVFNLDTHDGRGSHWTGLYIGLDPARPDRYGAWYYDSTAEPPMAGMDAFMRRVLREAAAAFPSAPPPTYWRNRTRKQFKNTECGVFSMFFIIACARTDAPVPHICTRLIKGDDDMHQLRAVYFRPFLPGEAGGAAPPATPGQKLDQNPTVPPGGAGGAGPRATGGARAR